MINFCTLFNINYLAKGLALHQSLVDSCPSFHLYMFAYDDETYQILSNSTLTNATIIPLFEIENELLLEVKKTRSTSEYCWTCKPFIVKHCFTEYKIPNCIYIDADTFFYNDASILLTEMGDCSVLITPHNYYNLYDQSSSSGIYCAQLVGFKNTKDGITVLEWWMQACLRWCYSYYEDGKWADQKYLDSWPYMFNGVHICRNIGAGVAPWNLLNHPLSGNGKQLMVKDTPLIFYHFHDLLYLSNNTWCIGGYEIPKHALTEIYQPYIKTLLSIDREIKKQQPEIDGLNTKDVNKMNTLSGKYKLGIYVLDLKAASRQFITALFFSDRRRHYKNNYIRIE